MEDFSKYFDTNPDPTSHLTLKWAAFPKFYGAAAAMLNLDMDYKFHFDSKEKGTLAVIYPYCENGTIPKKYFDLTFVTDDEYCLMGMATNAVKANIPHRVYLTGKLRMYFLSKKSACKFLKKVVKAGTVDIPDDREIHCSV